GLAGNAAETLRPGVVHPELAFEVDLAGGIPALLKQLDRQLGTLSRRDPRRTKTQCAHGEAAYRRRSRACPGGSRTPSWYASKKKKKGLTGETWFPPCSCCPTLFLRFFHAETPKPHRPAGARHRPPDRRSLA